MMLANLIGWIATIFRASGMVAKSPDMVKYLVSVGNLCWAINGIMTKNLPLIASNVICLAIMAVDMITTKLKKRK